MQELKPLFIARLRLLDTLTEKLQVTDLRFFLQSAQRLFADKALQFVQFRFGNAHVSLQHCPRVLQVIFAAFITLVFKMMIDPIDQLRIEPFDVSNTDRELVTFQPGMLPTSPGPQTQPLFRQALRFKRIMQTFSGCPFK